MSAPPIVQYKVLAFSQWWGNRGLTERVSAELNERTARWATGGSCEHDLAFAD
jgi:hypothetical protein